MLIVKRNPRLFIDKQSGIDGWQIFFDFGMSIFSQLNIVWIRILVCRIKCDCSSGRFREILRIVFSEEIEKVFDQIRVFANSLIDAADRAGRKRII